MKRSVTPIITAVLAAASLGATAGFARESNAQPSVDACSKTVDAIGSAMSHTETKDQNGRPAYLFVVRQNGLDYDVTCDPSSGLVSDVAPRQG